MTCFMSHKINIVIDSVTFLHQKTSGVAIQGKPPHTQL